MRQAISTVSWQAAAITAVVMIVGGLVLAVYTLTAGERLVAERETTT